MSENKGDLISRNELEETLAVVAKKFAKSDKQQALMGRVFYIIDHKPAVDAQPVVHGRWIPLETEIGLYGCSLCEHKILRARCNYCPDCGAKMDLED